MTATYGDVDGGDDPGGAADWQERIAGWPAIRQYKSHALAALPPGGTVLDIGCGPGTDLAAIGGHRAIGLDRSWTMVQRTARQHRRVCVGDAHRLPFATGAFNGCRADRVLQHVDEPAAVLGEMRRVTRPGGRIVVAEPDQESLVIHVPGVALDLVDKVKAARRDAGYRNGRLVGELPGRMAALGLTDVSVTAFPLLLTDPADAFGIAGWPRLWRERGMARFSDSELDRWAHGMERARQEGFVYALLYFVVAATVA
ncbi:MAG: hypothetical protein QOG64_2675 [Acidimicrobiaceae bacterium]|nr:hypothetical protein [Acidimicrobiaceae bacterium]